MTTDDQLALRDAACCLWEAVFSMPDGRSPGMADALSRHGTASIRLFCCQIAEQAEQAWRAVSPDIFDGCFDWEFCPVFVERCVDWQHPDGTPALRPEFMEMMTTWAATA